MNEFEAAIERIKAKNLERLAIIATLPCGPCEIDSKPATDCQFYGQGGCKHVDELGQRRRTEELARARMVNLENAGIQPSDIDGDEKLAMILRDTVEPWKSIHAVRRALASKSLRFLVLGGDHRTGKTLGLIYACAVTTDAVYIRAQQLSRLNQDTERWMEARLLCVNELGREHLGNGFTASNLDEIMAEREYGRKLTIFATNLPLKKKNPADPAELPALADRYGDLFVSRIGHKIGAYVKCEAGAVEAGPSTNNPTSFNERGER